MSMVLAVAKNRFLNLRHDRAAMILSFVLPVAFFSVFAGIFSGGSGRDATRKIPVALVDEDGSPQSRRFAAALTLEEGLRVVRAPEAARPDSPAAAFTRADAEAAVRSGDFPVALVIPKGFGSSPISFGPGGTRPGLEILSDSADPVAPQVLGGLVQKVVMTAMPASMARSGMAEVDKWSGGLTSEQRARLDESLAMMEREIEVPPGQPAPPAARTSGGGLVDVSVRDLVGEKKKNPTVAFYAAGLGVMFLLFSAAGAGGALIEEAESGTLDRILATRVSMTTLLLGKLVYLVALAVAQLTLMFVWGALFFGVELWSHLPGFFVMTLVTACACATFGLLLAAICRSRMQLVALSNLAILLMSALGGSMFPRFLMPEKMQKIGLATINGWAIDGFQKIFWRDEPVSALWPQVAVLLAVSVLFFLIARRVARRWEFA